MYRKRSKQIALFEDPVGFMGVKLDPNNRWVKMAKLIPWDAIEEKCKEAYAYVTRKCVSEDLP